MNRIRNINGIWQVLITPNIRISPDSSLLIGNWDDTSLRGYTVLTFDTKRDAQNIAFHYPDIDWYRIVLNQEYIFYRLNKQISDILTQHQLNVQYIPQLMDPITFKNTMFDRVEIGGGRFNLAQNMNDIISFTIVNPWTQNLFKIAKILEKHRIHLYRDDLRLFKKKIVDGKIIFLYGMTEFGTVYEIKLIPTLLYQWSEWYKKVGHLKRNNAMKLYSQYLNLQKTIDLQFPSF